MAVPPTPLSAERTKLRRALRVHRQALALANDYISLTTPVALAELLAPMTSLGTYRPMRGEPDPAPLTLGFTGVTSLPALAPDDAMMTFRRWSSGDRLVTSLWGGEQPADDAAPLRPDVIFVPLLGFDAAFHRIGQGGGHYDRYLAAHPAAYRIGIAWEAQRVDRIDAQPWDVALDAVLTEQAFHVKDLNRCQRL